MARVVTVGSSSNPNDKYPKFVDGEEYLMKVVSYEEFTADNYDRSGKETRLKWKLECVDQQNPQYIGKTIIYFSQDNPTKDLRNKLTQLILATIVRDPLVDNQQIDVDNIIGHYVSCTFKPSVSKGTTYENVVNLRRPGGFVDNAPVQSNQATVGTSVNLPNGWQQSVDPQTNKPMYLPPGGSSWQFDPPPQNVPQSPPNPVPQSAPQTSLPPMPPPSSAAPPMPAPQVPQAPLAPPNSAGAPPVPNAGSAPPPPPPPVESAQAPTGGFGWPEKGQA